MPKWWCNPKTWLGLWRRLFWPPGLSHKGFLSSFLGLTFKSYSRLVVSSQVSPLDANCMSALLKMKTHASVSQQKSSVRINPFLACFGAFAGDFNGLMNLLASTISRKQSLIPMCSGSLEAKSRENAKSAYLTGIFVGASSAIKLALWGLRDWWTPSLFSGNSEWLHTIELTFCLTILQLLSAPAPSLPSTTSLLSTLKADITDDLVIFNIAVSDIAILLKPWMKTCCEPTTVSVHLLLLDFVTKLTVYW